MKASTAASRGARAVRVQSTALANRVARRLPERSRVTTYMGYRFSYPSRSQIGRAVSRGIIWDKPLRNVVRTLPTGDSVCEVGANLGASLLTMCHERVDLKFVCFEGSPRFMGYLIQNVADNGLDDRVEVNQALIGPDTTLWTLSSDVTSGSVAGQNRLHRGLLFQERLESSSLDHWFAARKPPGLIKIDTDGFEFQVLSSGSGMLSRRRPHLFLEYCPALLSEVGDSSEKLLNLLLEIGYTVADLYSPTGELLESGVPIPEVTAGRYDYIDLAISGEVRSD